MLLHKILTAEEALELIAFTISKNLPREIIDSEAELNLAFNDDHSVEIYIMNMPEDKNSMSQN